jgi:hypothetical protein
MAKLKYFGTKPACKKLKTDHVQGKLASWHSVKNHVSIRSAVYTRKHQNTKSIIWLGRDTWSHIKGRIRGYELGAVKILRC